MFSGNSPLQGRTRRDGGAPPIEASKQFSQSLKTFTGLWSEFEAKKSEHSLTTVQIFNLTVLLDELESNAASTPNDKKGYHEKRVSLLNYLWSKLFAHNEQVSAQDYLNVLHLAKSIYESVYSDSDKKMTVSSQAVKAYNRLQQRLEKPEANVSPRAPRNIDDYESFIYSCFESQRNKTADDILSQLKLISSLYRRSQETTERDNLAKKYLELYFPLSKEKRFAELKPDAWIFRHRSEDADIIRYQKALALESHKAVMATTEPVTRGDLVNTVTLLCYLATNNAIAATTREQYLQQCAEVYCQYEDMLIYLGDDPSQNPLRDYIPILVDALRKQLPKVPAKQEDVDSKVLPYIRLLKTIHTTLGTQYADKHHYAGLLKELYIQYSKDHPSIKNTERWLEEHIPLEVIPIPTAVTRKYKHLYEPLKDLNELIKAFNRLMLEWELNYIDQPAKAKLLGLPLVFFMQIWFQGVVNYYEKNLKEYTPDKQATSKTYQHLFEAKKILTTWLSELYFEELYSKAQNGQFRGLMPLLSLAFHEFTNEFQGLLSPQRWYPSQRYRTPTDVAESLTNYSSAAELRMASLPLPEGEIRRFMLHVTALQLLLSGEMQYRPMAPAGSTIRPSGASSRRGASALAGSGYYSARGSSIGSPGLAGGMNDNQALDPIVFLEMFGARLEKLGNSWMREVFFRFEKLHAALRKAYMPSDLGPITRTPRGRAFEVPLLEQMFQSQTTAYALEKDWFWYRGEALRHIAHLTRTDFPDPQSTIVYTPKHRNLRFTVAMLPSNNNLALRVSLHGENAGSVVVRQIAMNSGKEREMHLAARDKLDTQPPWARFFTKPLALHHAGPDSVIEVCEFCDRGDLEDLMRSEKLRSDEDRLVFSAYFLDQLVSLVDETSQDGFFYPDLKGPNCLLRKNVGSQYFIAISDLKSAIYLEPGEKVNLFHLQYTPNCSPGYLQRIKDSAAVAYNLTQEELIQIELFQAALTVYQFVTKTPLFDLPAPTKENNYSPDYDFSHEIFKTEHGRELREILQFLLSYSDMRTVHIDRVREKTARLFSILTDLRQERLAQSLLERVPTMDFGAMDLPSTPKPPERADMEHLAFANPSPIKGSKSPVAGTNSLGYADEELGDRDDLSIMSSVNPESPRGSDEDTEGAGSDEDDAGTDLYAVTFSHRHPSRGTTEPPATVDFGKLLGSREQRGGVIEAVDDAEDMLVAPTQALSELPKPQSRQLPSVPVRIPQDPPDQKFSRKRYVPGDTRHAFPRPTTTGVPVGRHQSAVWGGRPTEAGGARSDRHAGLSVGDHRSCEQGGAPRAPSRQFSREILPPPARGPETAKRVPPRPLPPLKRK